MIIKHSLQAWATSLTMERRTLESRMIKNGDTPKKHEKISAQRIFTALYGEMYAEELRGKKLDNDKKERAARKADGSLCEWEMVEKITNESFILPLIAAFDSAPDTVSRDWIEKVLKPVMRTKLQLPK